jgi:putative ABC transport system ATP-binding protein
MIEAVDVHKTFHSGDEVVEALRGVTFRLPAGSCTFIVGPSGSGKSTLLYLLAALDLPTSGAIFVAGQDITAMSEAERDDYRRNRVGFIFQSYNLISNLSAVDNVLLPYIPVGVTPELRSKAAELLKQVGLGHRMKLRPRQMSGGEQQRVAIARALIRDPIVVFGDEPTGNLDRAGGDRIIQLLRDRQREGNRTLVIVTHDRRFITRDDIVLEIEDGRLRGEPSAVLNPAGAAP